MSTIPQRSRTFRIILDESVAFLGDTSSSSMVRGEVIVNFEYQTRISGPIQLVFAGTQIVYPWKGMSTLLQWDSVMLIQNDYRTHAKIQQADQNKSAPHRTLIATSQWTRNHASRRATFSI